MKKLSLVFLVALMPVLAWSQNVPAKLGFQGRLVDKNGAPMTGQQQITFLIYGVPEGGDPLWSETQTLSLTNGFYSTFLGAQGNLDKSKFNGVDLYVAVKIGNDELKPRQQIGSVAYALMAGQAVEANHATTATNLTIAPDKKGSVTTNSISVGLDSNGQGLATIKGDGTISGGAITGSIVNSKGDINATGTVKAGAVSIGETEVINGNRDIVNVNSINGGTVNAGNVTAESATIQKNLTVNGRLRGRVVGGVESASCNHNNGNLNCTGGWGGASCQAQQCARRCTGGGREGEPSVCEYVLPASLPIVCPSGSSLHRGLCIDDG